MDLSGRPSVDVVCDNCRRNNPHGATQLAHMVWESMSPRSTPEWRTAILIRVSESKRPPNGLLANGSYMYGPRHDFDWSGGLPTVKNHRGVYAPLRISAHGTISIRCRRCRRDRVTSWVTLQLRAKAAVDGGRTIVSL